VSNKILFVDDEPAVLDGYRRILHKDFEIETSTSGEDALSLVSNQGPFAVIVSDMRMPAMNGVQFLSKVSSLANDTVRVVLTGYADFQSAMAAVNEGKLFRFLTKPCEGEVLKQCLVAALEQYRLITAEKDLLEKTLVGSIEVLTDVLSLASPVAFSRAKRLRRYVKAMNEKLNLPFIWKIEMAALLSQLGCITLTPEIIEKAHLGEHLNADQRAAFEKHPQIARDLLLKIPRLQDIAWIIAQERRPIGTYDSEATDDLKLASEVLRVAIAFDDFIAQRTGDMEAHERLRFNPHIPPRVLRSLSHLHPSRDQGDVRFVKISDLAVGMVLQEEVRTDSGILVVVRGQEITYPLVARLTNFYRQNSIPGKFLVSLPV